MKICGSLTGSQIGLIAEAFEQSTETGGEGDVLPCSISLLQPDLTPRGTMSLQIPAWHRAGSRAWEGWEEPGVVLQSFVFIHILLTRWQKSAGIFFFFFLHSAGKIVEG